MSNDDVWPISKNRKRNHSRLKSVIMQEKISQSRQMFHDGNRQNVCEVNGPERHTSQTRQNIHQVNIPMRKNYQNQQHFKGDNNPMRQHRKKIHEDNRHNSDPALHHNPGMRYHNNDPQRRRMRGGRGNMKSSRDNEMIRFLGFKALEEISQAEEKDVLQKLNEKREGFMNVVNTSHADQLDYYVLLIRILSKLTQSPFVELKSKLLLDVCNSEFINYLMNYLMDLPYAEPDKTRRNANSLYWNDQSEFWNSFITFCADLVETAPTIARRRCRALIDSITKTCLEGLKDKHGFALSEANVLKLDEIRQKLTTYSERYQPERKRMKLDIHDEQVQQPPECFRELSVVPTKDDLLGSMPFLRPNIVEGGYSDVEHYLDVQFRLLREDCFGPFRDGLNQFLADPNKWKYDHVRIFHNVRFLCPYVANLKVGAIAQIDLKSHKNFQRINWAHNKRFLFGSLVLFTKDNCTTFMAATILHRDVHLLSTGKIPVSVIDTDLDNSIFNDDKYTMIESEVYFEPYYHVLKVLQETSFPQHLAMQQYIVKVDAASTHPAYLSADTEFVIYKDNKLKEIEDPDTADSDNDVEDPGTDEMTDEEQKDEKDIEEASYLDTTDLDSDVEELVRVEMTHGGHKNLKFKVLEPETWPTTEELHFNKSQYEAYRLALTHEFAVIQGPPGTGKTFIGVKVAKTLLQNVRSEGNCLMLIICYTNHALDQFLEAISHITRSIVRIGGQSRNKAMDQFNLSNLRHQTLSPSLRAPQRFIFNQKDHLRESIQDLQLALKTLDILNNGVLSYPFLMEHGDIHTPDVQHLEFFYKNKGIRVEDPLEYWLFEVVLGYKSEYERDFDDCILNYDSLLNSEEDVDEKRTNIMLGDEKASHDQKALDNLVKNRASFLVSNAKANIKELVLFYKESGNFNERQKLKKAIQELDARINLFNDMANYRNRIVRLNVHSYTNFSSIPVQNRWCMYFTWVRPKINVVREEIGNLQASVAPSLAAYDEARMMMDLQLVKHKRVKVVGMTTSGAARMRKLLLALAPKIVIVEEAAEVLEQHIITSLTKDCQHFILIGDHQQLRPSASHIKLAKNYKIEVSLFERMITNGIHSRRLNVQHRMRPEIAALISPHIYPDLGNHPSVEAFRNVPGVEKNLYFFTHEYREENHQDNNSRANHKEADMALGLANYLMQQGYTADDVTILAAYSGQMFYMRKERQKYASLSHVKITVVDNYQGEESKIIILSLVRNNEENMIGFLGTDNRVCVALSRAKEGLYIFGNINMLKTAKSGLWTKIATTLENNGSLGTTLILKCQNHPDQITKISSPEDFHKLPPDGGCFEKCNYQYECGHKCQLHCHGYDREHINTKCTMDCERVVCELGHVCPLKCCVVCKPCQVIVRKALPCGHEIDTFCHREPEDPRNICLMKVDVTLPDCEHKAQKICYQEIKEVKCLTRCVYRLECGHVCGRYCHVTDDPNHENYTCFKPCARAKAGCGADLVGDRGDHQCKKRCYEKCDDCNVQMEKVILECLHSIKLKCNQSPSHELCNEKCKLLLSCGHPCTDRCGAACDPSKCSKPSSAEALSPCGHRVSLPCNVSALFATGEVPSEQLPAYCGAACGAELACGHVCAGCCAACLQGRLHQPCSQQCNQENICGHQCQEPCNQICPPCKMPCEVKCIHSHCKKLCGEPCTPCQEKCKRACVHGACSRRCGEPCARAPCDRRCARRRPCAHVCRGLCARALRPALCAAPPVRPRLPRPVRARPATGAVRGAARAPTSAAACARAPCDRRCARRRPCAHACRGLCGEPCPDICQLCRPDDFPRDCLGDQYEQTDKFIVLQDCNHVLEVDYMDCIMMGDQENIQIRKCPLCRKAIINTNRYKDIVNKMFKDDINPIKLRIYGTRKQIQIKLTKLCRKVDIFTREYQMFLGDYLKAILLNFTSLLKDQKNVSLLQVEMESVYFNIFEMIVECWKMYRTQTPPVTTLKEELKKHIKILLGVLKIKPKSRIPIKISEQQQKDVGNEIKRLNVMVQLSKLLHLAILTKDEQVTRQVETTKAVVFSLSVFNEDRALESLKQLQKVIKTNATVTKYERELIVKAIGLKAGHWYKCPNGHYYCIGECGGAMARGRCPEVDCGAAIGGERHVLTAGNSHAPEMDGSSFAAWSEQANNMANFALDDIL